MVYLSYHTNNKRGIKPDASILRKVSNKEGDEGLQDHQDEERQTGDPGNVSGVWNQDVPNRQSLK